MPVVVVVVVVVVTVVAVVVVVGRFGGVLGGLAGLGAAHAEAELARPAHLADVLGEVLEAAGLTTDDVDWVVPHQANARIIDATARKLGLPAERVVLTVDRHANTSAASVPLALDVAVKDGRIKRGDCVVLEAMGGGFTWGAAALRF